MPTTPCPQPNGYIYESFFGPRSVSPVSKPARPSSKSPLLAFVSNERINEHSLAKSGKLTGTFFDLLSCKISGSRRLSPVQAHYGIKWYILFFSLQLYSCQCPAQKQKNGVLSVGVLFFKLAIHWIRNHCGNLSPVSPVFFF